MLAILTIIFFTAAALTYTGIVFKWFPNSATINLLDYFIIGIALVFGMTAFLGFPPDTAESSQDISSPITRVFSNGPMVILWKFLYFGWIAFNWSVVFFYKQILNSGHWNFWGRLGHGMLRTMTIYLLIGIPAAIVFIVLIATKKFTVDVLYTLLISIVNTFGTFQIVLLLAYGIVDVPRRLVISAFPTLRLYQIYYDAFKTTRNIRKIYKNILSQRSKQSIGLAIIPRSNHMYVYSNRLIEMQLVPNEKLEALAETASASRKNDIKTTALTKLSKPLKASTLESNKQSKSVPVLSDKFHFNTIDNPCRTEDSKKKRATVGTLPPKSNLFDTKTASTYDLLHNTTQKYITEYSSSSKPSRSSSASASANANSHLRMSSTLANDPIEMSASKHYKGPKDTESSSSAFDIHPEGCVTEKPSTVTVSRYYTQEVKLAGRLVTFPKEPSIDDIPVCSCNCRGGPPESINKSIVQGLKLVEKSNFKLKFLYWSAMREHGAMEHLVVQRNRYEMLVNCRKKGNTLEDLRSQPNLNPYWAKVFGHARLGKMTYVYIKYFRSFLLIMVAILFTFFSVVLVLSEFMSPISSFSLYSPLLLCYQHVVEENSSSTVLILVYAIFGLLVAYLQCALLNLRFFNIYRLARKSTDITSLLFIIARVPTYIFPLGWNLMLLLNIELDTAYGKVMAKMSALPIMGIGFSNYFPIVMIVLTIFFASNLDRIVWAAMGQDITPNMICRLRNSYKVEEGKENLDQWVTGTFEYLETEENTPKKPPSCCSKCFRSVFAPADGDD